jgi:hypothetical protein
MNPAANYVVFSYDDNYPGHFYLNPWVQVLANKEGYQGGYHCDGRFWIG